MKGADMDLFSLNEEQIISLLVRRAGIREDLMRLFRDTEDSFRSPKKPIFIPPKKLYLYLVINYSYSICLISSVSDVIGRISTSSIA